MGYIETLERHDLEGTTAASFSLAHVFGTQSFLHIRGLADFWSTHPDVDFWQCITDLVISTHCQSRTFLTFVLAGTPQHLSVYLSLGTPDMTQALIEGILPGVSLETDLITGRIKVSTDLASVLTPHCREQGVISGIPSRKIVSHARPASISSTTRSGNSVNEGDEDTPSGATEGQGLSHLERVIRGMSGATWAYIVRAYPRPRSKVLAERLETIDKLAEVASHLRGQVQKNTQTGQTLSPIKNLSSTETISGEIVNYRAQHLMQLLERELARQDRALAVGQWTVDTYFGAATSGDAQRLSSLLVGTLAGKDSRPDPLRSYKCENGTSTLHTDHYKTYLSSEEIATLIQLPREEVPGYAISDFARFDVDFHTPTSPSIMLGTIQQNAKDTHDSYRIGLNDLAKHAVVLGVTGSGKTTTVLNLLDHAISAKIPFLVIEPAKTEYRPLQAALAGTADVRVYTVGNEKIAPFRFNPFEFETNDTPGSGSVLSHIDFLKAVFNAAFILYAPMPYILETALHEIYEDKGWELASGRNVRLPDAEWVKRHTYPIFPTLTDLYRKIEEVTTRLRYHGEIEQNVIAGLKARVGSLRLGSKGFMLDTARGVLMSELLSLPTILELESIGNDDEKTFLMGLLLTRLYEYRRLQSAYGTIPGGLQHLLVFEEAHRLLKHTQTQVGTEEANPRAQAIEAFTNMLSEVRGYGQGVVVAEQIPSKLAPDVLKNTNLKIAHRLVAQDDRKSVGQTMNLNASQMTHLGVLLPGIAAVYAEGADHAYVVHMENYKSTHRLANTTDSELEKVSTSYISLENYLAISHIQAYGIKMNHFNGPEMAIYQAASVLLETEECKQWWASVLLSVTFHRTKLLDILEQLPQLIAAKMPHLQLNQQEILRLMVLVRGAAEMLSERGTEVGWTYPLVEELRQYLTRGLVILLRTHDLTRATGDLDSFTRKYKLRLERKYGPFAGCKHCSAKCIYHSEVSRILSQEDIRWIDVELENLAASTTPHDYTAMAKVVEAISKQWLESPHVLAADIGYCGALHAVNRLDLPRRAQVQFGDLLASHLLL